jgi:glycosyltransferase involved in cell wall biosynthesis
MGDVAVASSWDNALEISAIRKEGEVTVLPDGTRLRMFEGLPSREVLRETYTVPEDKVVVTYTGALIPNKGIKLFLEAIPLLATKYTEVHFVVAGFPVDQITDYTSTEVFKKRVTIVSPLPYYDLPKVLRMSDIGVDPKDASVRQASGKTLQYMGAGLPVAVFDTENNREYLADGGTYAKEATAESLALAIGELIESSELRQSRGQICRERAGAFSWEHTAELAEGLYQTILNKN